MESYRYERGIQPDNLKDGKAFWQALTAGAVSTASAED